MDLTRQYTGSLYIGDQITKGWAVIGKGHVSVSIAPCSRNKKWKLLAMKEDHKVWECLVEDGFTYKLRDNFVQWSYVNLSKEKVTYGFRIKEASVAQEFVDLLALIVNSSPSNEKQLNITLPSKQRVGLTFKKKITMAGVLKHTALQHSLEISLYALAAVNQSGTVTSLKPSMTVDDLGLMTEIAVVKRNKTGTPTLRHSEIPKQSPSKQHPEEEEIILLNVNLPNGSIFKTNVKPSINLLDLQRLICIQNGLNPAAHKFDLLIANQDKVRLRQLKISTITLIRKDGVIEGNEGTDGVSVTGSLKTKVRVAPPPPKSPSTKHTSSQVLHNSLLSNPSSKTQTESTDGSPEDVNDFVSRMLSQQAIGKPNTLSYSPAKDLTRRKLNPAPLPPTSKQTKQEAHTVKRTAPPPPKQDSSLSTQSREEVDSSITLEQMKKPHGGIALPCMTKKPQTSISQNRTTTPQETRKKESSPLISRRVAPQIQEKSNNKTTPILDRITPPSSNSPTRKPTRKAPTKPPPQSPSKQNGSRSGQIQPVTMPIAGRVDKVQTSNVNQQQSRIVVATPQERQTQNTPGTFVFQIPPPPPKKPPPGNSDMVDESPKVAETKIKYEEEVSEDESIGESEETASTAGSSMYGGYNIETGKPFDRPSSSSYYTSSGSEHSEHSDSSEGSTEQSETDSGSDDETDSNTDQRDLQAQSSTNTYKEEDTDSENEETTLNTSLRHKEEENDEIEEPKRASANVTEPETSSDEDAIDDGGIMLISHLKTDTVYVDIIVDDEDHSSKPIDDKISSLRNLIADTCVLGGKENVKKQDSIASVGSESDFNLTAIQQMGPPPDTVSIGVTNTNLSVPPLAPPPPPINNDKSDSEQPPLAKPKPPPPAVKPKPRPLPTTNNIEDELAHKLKRRQHLMDNPDDITKDSVQSFVNPPTITQVPVPVPAPNIGTGSIPIGLGMGGVQGVSSGGSDVQLQLQMLQQQMLQQQMMQMQQQFQQLQSMMVTNPTPAASLLLQQQMQQMQAMQQPPNTGMMMMQSPPQTFTTPSSYNPALLGPAQMMMLPHQNPLGMTNQPQMTTSIQSQPMLQHMAAMQHPTFVPPVSQTMPLVPSPSPPAILLSQVPCPPPLHDQEDSVEHTPNPAKSLSRKPSEADIRMKALGTTTDKFDNLMDEVRDTNPFEILKKVSDNDREQHHDSAYTGMTGALVQAMRERRKSFQDPDYINKRESIESNSAEWD